MDRREAEETISRGKFLRPMYSKFSQAEGFLAGSNLERKRAGKLVDWLEKTSWLHEEKDS